MRISGLFKRQTLKKSSDIDIPNMAGKQFVCIIKKVTCKYKWKAPGIDANFKTLQNGVMERIISRQNPKY